MADNPLLEAAEHGQSIWLDNITRGMIRDGSLQKLIDEDGISGVTSNPAIFNKAMTRGSDYDDQIRKLGAARSAIPKVAMMAAPRKRDVSAARRTPAPSPRPTARPTRTEAEMDIPTGTMKVNAARFRATWWPARGLVPM